MIAGCRPVLFDSCHRPGLQDEELGIRVETELDVLRATELPLDGPAGFGDLADSSSVRLLRLRSCPKPQFALAHQCSFVHNQLLRLFGQLRSDVQGVFVNGICVGGKAGSNQTFADPQQGTDHNLMWASVGRIAGEHHSDRWASIIRCTITATAMPARERP